MGQTREQKVLKNMQSTPFEPKTAIATDMFLTNHSGIRDRVRIKKVFHAYGGFQDKAEVIDCVKDVWKHVTNITNNLWTGLEVDGLTLSGDIMTVAYGGDYYGHLSMTVSSGQANDFQIRAFNITQNMMMGYKIGLTTTGAGNYATFSLPLYLECNAGDQLKVEVINLTDGDDLTCRNAVFYISYLHE